MVVVDIMKTKSKYFGSRCLSSVFDKEVQKFSDIGKYVLFVDFIDVIKCDVLLKRVVEIQFDRRCRTPS